jgi:beta propeller repeat protein
LAKDKSSVPQDIGLGETGIVVNMSFTGPQRVDAFFYRFADQRLTNVSQRAGGVWQTAMSGSRIVWTQDMWPSLGEGPYSQIVLYDTTTNEKRVLAPGNGSQYKAHIRWDKVVWVDNRNSPGTHLDLGNSDIYLHDLKTQQTTPVCTDPAQQDNPDADGDFVAWEDWRNNPNPTPRYSNEYQNSDIYLKDLRTGKEVQLTQFKGFELMPRVDGGRVFYVMSDGKKASVFMIDAQELLGQ